MGWIDEKKRRDIMHNRAVERSAIGIHSGYRIRKEMSKKIVEPVSIE